MNDEGRMNAEGPAFYLHGSPFIIQHSSFYIPGVGKGLAGNELRWDISSMKIELESRQVDGKRRLLSPRSAHRALRLHQRIDQETWVVKRLRPGKTTRSS